MTRIRISQVFGTEEIQVHNADGLCIEESCSNKPTRYQHLVFSDDHDKGRIFLQILVPLCDEHAEILDDKTFLASSEFIEDEIKGREKKDAQVKIELE